MRDAGELNGFGFDPQAAASAWTALDAMAAELTAELDAVEQDMTVPAAGADEVSGQAAVTHNEVAGSYFAQARAGVHEIRKLAAQLRLMHTSVQDMEAQNEAEFGRAGGSSV